MSEESTLVGQEIGGKYRIVRLIGEGGMGAVYLGEQKLGATLRKVAIKTLHAHLSHDPKIKARFERECSTIAELQHPNTIQIYDFGETPEGLLYIVMEYVEGRSVADILEKEGPMEPARVLKIMQQVCGSLEEAHSRGIVHRDLKPDNVVLSERAGQKDWVEVLDFGIAKRANENDPNEQKLTQQGMVLGTPPYMSPEQFTGKIVDARSDIYSLGVMAYEMLTGRLPFSGNTAWEWATQHMTARPVAIESLPAGTRVPPAMRAAINRALAKTPEERFQTAKEFIDAFGGDGSALHAAAITPPEASPRQKTEMAQPIEPPPGAFASGGTAMTPVIAAPGPMQQSPAPMMHAPAMMQGAPSSSSNQGFAASSTTHGGDERGSKRGLIFAAIGVLSVATIGLILAGLGVFDRKTPAQDVSLTGTTTPPQVTAPPVDTTPPPATPETATSVAPLDPGRKPPSHETHEGHPQPSHSASAATGSSAHPPTTTTTTTTPPSNPNPNPPVTTTTPPPHVPIPECELAKRFCTHPAIRTDRSIQNLCTTNKQACFAKGGTL